MLILGFSSVGIIAILLIFALFWNPQYAESTDEKKEFDHYSEKLLLKAESGDAQAQHALGNCYFYGFGVPKDAEEAVKWFRKAAEQHYSPAENDLGHCYYNGTGVERDEAMAEWWWQRATKDSHDPDAED